MSGKSQKSGERKQRFQSKSEIMKTPRLPLNEIEGTLRQNGYFPGKYEEIYEPPNFSIKELRDAIPAHLFERSLLKSSAYLIVNLIAVGLIFYAGTYIEDLPKSLRSLCWLLYWWFQGVAGFGVWVIAHECGHHTFSDYRKLNHTVGFILHTLLLVPYHNWRISHAIHHANTANMEQDQNYVPRTKSEYKRKHPSPIMEAIEASSVFNMGLMVLVLIFGWSSHLILLKSGQAYPDRQGTLLLPSSPVFRKQDRLKVFYSNVAVLLVVEVLSYLAYQTSLLHIIKMYLIPHLIIHAWLVTVTFLHHTDVYLPHYSKRGWSFTRGALATVDRDYGWFLNMAFHHINDSHVAHHLFSQMPHYNAIQATPYLKNKLGEYYFYDRTPWWKALYRGIKSCKFVEDTGDVLFYRQG